MSNRTPIRVVRGPARVISDTGDLIAATGS
jgi:hypothetical protein